MGNKCSGVLSLVFCIYSRSLPHISEVRYVPYRYNTWHRLIYTGNRTKILHGTGTHRWLERTSGSKEMFCVSCSFNYLPCVRRCAGKSSSPGQSSGPGSVVFGPAVQGPDPYGTVIICTDSDPSIKKQKIRKNP